jgi:hypothetical protein
MCPEAHDSVGQRIATGIDEHWLVVNTSGGRVLFYLWPAQSGDTVVAYSRTQSPGFHTTEQLGVGASLGALRSAYGIAALEYNQPRLFADFTAKPGVEFTLCWTPPGGWHGDSTLNSSAVPDSARVCELNIIGKESIIRGGD